MKRLVFSLCALLMAGIMCFGINYYLKRSAEDFSKSALKCSQTVRDEKDISVLAQKLEAQWQEKRRIISLFAPEKTFEETEKEIRNIKYSSSIEEFKNQCLKAAELVKRSSEADFPTIENIF